MRASLAGQRRSKLLKENKNLQSHVKFQSISLKDLITPAKAFRNTILNVQDREQWLKETYKIQEQNHGLGVEMSQGSRTIDHELCAAVTTAVSGKSYAMEGEHPFSHKIFVSCVPSSAASFSDSTMAIMFGLEDLQSASPCYSEQKRSLAGPFCGSQCYCAIL